jgi:hypothetical protein
MKHALVWIHAIRLIPTNKSVQTLALAIVPEPWLRPGLSLHPKVAERVILDVIFAAEASSDVIQTVDIVYLRSE